MEETDEFNHEENFEALPMEKHPDFPWLPLFGFLLLVLIVAVAVTAYQRSAAGSQGDFWKTISEKEYRYSLSPQVEKYWEWKAMYDGDDIQVMRTQLFNRALSNVSLLLHIQKLAPGTFALYTKGMIEETAWRNFKQSEDLMKAELDDVRAEADSIHPDWGATIWNEAVQYHSSVMLKRQQEQMETLEREMAKKQAANKKKAEKQKEKRQEKKALTAEQKAEMIAAELIAEEEKKKGKSGRSKKKR